MAQPAFQSNVTGLRPAQTHPSYPQTAKVYSLAEHRKNKGKNVIETITDANERRLVILGNKLIDPRLTGPEAIYQNEQEIYPLWTGTLVIYTKPGEKLGDYVTYTDSETGTTYAIKIPKEYQNAKNCVLVIDHGFDEKGNPVFELHVDGKNKYAYNIPDESKLQLIENLPAKDGWYMTEAGFYIPVRNKVDSANAAARYLYRTEKYVGLLARGYYGLDDYDDWRGVGAGGRPSGRFGVLVMDANPEGVAAEKITPALAEKQAEPSAQEGRKIIVPVSIDLNGLAASANNAFGVVENALNESVAGPIRAFIDTVRGLLKE